MIAVAEAPMRIEGAVGKMPYINVCLKNLNVCMYASSHN